MPELEKHVAPQTQCSICTQLADEEYAFSKYGSDIPYESLPAAVNSLVLVKEFNSNGSRRMQLERCPECGTYYLYRTDYEYLVNGTEDEEFLTRLTDERCRIPQPSDTTGIAPAGYDHTLDLLESVYLEIL